VDPGWHEVGSLRLASSTARKEELRRQVAWARTFGLPLELISAREAQDRFPLMSLDGVRGAVWLPTDGWLDPSGLALAMAAGARAGGAAIRKGARVVAVSRERGRVTGVTVEEGGERGELRTEIVVNAGGMYAPDIARLVGVTVPIIPMAPELDLWRMDIRRFGATYRSQRHTPGADAGGVRDLLRHPLSERGAPRRPAAAHRPDV